MNLKAQLMRIYLPESRRREALDELFHATAAVFRVARPATRGASADELLDRYARFTAEHAAAALRTGSDLPRIRRELYNAAYAIGVRLRGDLALSSIGDAMAAARAVYRALRIDFRGTAEGDVRIQRCYFSRFYSASVCQLVSELDKGLLSGLSGGGRLEFRQRITEGAPCCLARLTEGVA